MSQQEFDRADEQVIGVVESHAHPDAKKRAEKICKGEQKVATQDDSAGDTQAAELRRGILLTAIQVLSCILVAALMDASFVTFLVNIGVLVCGMVAAILVDRAIRTWRKG